jgi:hypothetical protein
MAAEPGRAIGHPLPSQCAQPLVGCLRPAWQAGRVRALREAQDDARIVLAFVQTGMRSRCIDPAHPVWVVDLSPGDGERAWHLLRIFEAGAQRGPPLRYLACCPDPAQYDVLAAHASFAAWRSDGRLCLDRHDRGLPPHPLRNPVVVLAHEAFSARAQHLFRMRNGEVLQAWRHPQGRIEWRDLRRRDGACRLLSGQRGARDGLSLTLPHAGMAMLDALLQASGGRLLLRATDDGRFEPERIAAEGLRVDGETPPQVNFEALARWHRANGGQALQSRSVPQGRVLHHALHDAGDGRLRECLPELLALPHPDDHAELLAALDAISRPSLLQCIALLRAHGGDPRALALLAERLPEAAVEADADLPDDTASTWRNLVAWSESMRYPIDGMAASREADHE